MIAPLQLEGVPLPEPLPSFFERFYRTNLRRITGARIRSSDLMRAYQSWALANGECSINYLMLARLMAATGHRKVTSNGVHFTDVGFVADHAQVTDTLPSPFVGSLPPVASRRSRKKSPDLIAKVDAALLDLLEIRKALSALAEPSEPHLAVQFTLGLS
ncbi:hypothetical protein EWE75_04255 [Sphingomonas populi]|uniref:Uncharacterized protein n=1 Tax=Sphingomonas populi TaxID=2484750 RepID=A0A4Q6Y0R6_9SPHN|nr:hypothetical protein [Sphingomonas populi]RZF65871.1 hypothetical protein EWE75_04255 [Sphingomonas populi]